MKGCNEEKTVKRETETLFDSFTTPCDYVLRYCVKPQKPKFRTAAVPVKTRT